MYALYRDSAYFITIYVIEPHPSGSASPYSGEEWTGSASTDCEGNPVTQPQTYQERVSLALQMINELKITVPVLIDKIDNPLWSTYGPAPNIAYLISTDGIVIEKQNWYQPAEMKHIIEQHLE